MTRLDTSIQIEEGVSLHSDNVDQSPIFKHGVNYTKGQTTSDPTTMPGDLCISATTGNGRFSLLIQKNKCHPEKYRQYKKFYDESAIVHGG